MVPRHRSNESSHTSIGFGSNGVKQALGKGQLTFHLSGGGHLAINNVYHVPYITMNLLSTSQATSNGTTSSSIITKLWFVIFSEMASQYKLLAKDKEGYIQLVYIQ